MPTKEQNEVRMVGVLPSQGADPIPVRLSTEAAVAGMIETNEVEMIGVLPSQGADPIPVSGMLYPSPITISAAAFGPYRDTYDYFIAIEGLGNRTALSQQDYHASICLPHGVTVTKVTLYGYRDDGLATLRLLLRRTGRVGDIATMSDITAGWTTGWSSAYDDSITNPLIDNDDYSYGVVGILDPNDSVLDVKFSGVKVEFTV